MNGFGWTFIGAGVGWGPMWLDDGMLPGVAGIGETLLYYTWGATQDDDVKRAQEQNAAELMSQLDIDGALVVADRVREQAALLPDTYGVVDDTTVSIGVVCTQTALFCLNGLSARASRHHRSNCSIGSSLGWGIM